MKYSLTILGLFGTLVFAAPAAVEKKQLPLVIWHGLGDQFDSPGLQEVAELAEKTNPGTYVHIVRLGADGGADRTATFFGRVSEQLNEVCNQLSGIPELENGFNAIGFSQGGQFLRGYVEKCNDPPVHTLITYGSQHNGITDFLPNCVFTDWTCRAAEALLTRAKFASYVQNKLVPAQYYRDPEDLDNYLEYSLFLADINNERPEIRNRLDKQAYGWRLSSLRKFVMVGFEDDTTVVPKHTAFFAEFNQTSGEVTKLEDRPIYKEDWIGLKKLGEKGALEYLTTPGDHMQLPGKVLTEHFKKYLGPTSDLEFVDPQAQPKKVVVEELAQGSRDAL